jgi:TolA-binding protein
MKVSPSSPILLCTGILLVTSAWVFADTVQLKSGEVLNGKILSETDQQLVMDVTVASGITDQQTVAKADVQTVTKTPLDVEAYETIKDYQIDTHSLQRGAYPAMMKALEAFLKDYPQSARASEVQATLNAFKQEETRVKAGQLKWENRWYTAEEIEQHKYQLGAAMSWVAMKDQAARRDFITALNTFAQIEKNYPGSAVFPDAVELAQKMCKMAGPEMDRLRNTAKVQETQFNTGIVLVAEPQKSQMIAARQSQIATAEASLAAAEHAGVKWKPLYPMVPKSFDTLKATLVTEVPRLEKLPLADMRSSLALTQQADTEIKAQKLNGVEAKLKDATKLWSQNEQVKELTDELTAIKAKPTATPTPAPSPASEEAPKKKYSLF